MTIKLDPITCKEMEGIPVSDEDCKITKEFILNLTRKLTLDGFGQAYAHGLTKIRDDDEDAIMVQGIYIALNCDTETEEQKEAQHILSHLRSNKPLPSYKPKENIMTESELEHIQLNFEKWTENKVRKGDKLSLKDYEEYAEFKEYPLEKVLVANPWSDEVLKDDVIKAIKEANKKIKIDWEEE